MLKAIDRIQIATEDAAATARGWWQLRGAEFETEDRIEAIGAKRFAYRLGRGYVDFLEPDDDDGAVAKGLQAHGRMHIFAADVATGDFDGLIDRLIWKKPNPFRPMAWLTSIFRGRSIGFCSMIAPFLWKCGR